MWKCKHCGKCCKFIVVPVSEPVDPETEMYLEAHGIAYDGDKIIIPARCEHLKEVHNYDETKGKPKFVCAIHTDKFSNCRLSGEKECKQAQKDYEKIKT